MLHWRHVSLLSSVAEGHHSWQEIYRGLFKSKDTSWDSHILLGSDMKNQVLICFSGFLNGSVGIRAPVSQMAAEKGEENHCCYPVFVLAPLLFAYQPLQYSNTFHEYKAVATYSELRLNSTLVNNGGASVFLVIYVTAMESQTYTISSAN